LIGNFGDDDLIGAAAGVLLRPAGAQAEGAAPRPVGLDDILAGLDDDATGREVWARHEVHQLVGGRFGEFDQVERGIA
jgi:hypothetical protein